MSRVPAWLAPSARLLAFVVAAACAAKAWSLLDENGANFDAAMGWDAAALLLLVAIALPAVRIDGARLRGAGGWAAGHRVELALLGLVLAAGVFMRLYGFGTLPPTHGTGLEENQTGGLAWRILNDGKRPLEFAFTNYTAALGFSVFGYTPDGMRLPFLILGVASLLPFYVLLRLLVSTPAALFATALLAVCRWQALSVRFADELFFGASLTIFAALLLVVVLKTRSRLAVLGLALLTGALNYEYVSYRHVPFLIAAALLTALAIAVRRRAVESGDIWASITQTARAYATSIAIFVLGVFIVVTPLAVAQLNGGDVYTEAFQRHAEAEPDRAVFGLL
ncbi:MAG TPA: glycosyltransferase family 39 protein, partial [Dehalococcoidia bacterium]|nr:glycosyltransferase family 39 protein [Dehalococcoidia bacterium]